MVVNPGEGDSSGSQRPQRLQRTLTFSVFHPFADLWMLQASVRLERLTANVLGSVLLDGGAGPLSAPVEAWLPELKLAIGRVIPLAPRWQFQVGASVALRRAIPETDRFVPTGSGPPWIQRVDLRLGLDWVTGHQAAAGIAVEVFNLFDSARSTMAAMDGRSVRLSSRVSF